MAKGVRNAGIRIEIEGERELTAQIKRMQQEFKTLVKEIELTQATFSGQRNTLKALEAEYNATQNAIKKLTDIHDKLKQKADIIDNSLKRETAERDRLHDKLKLEQQLQTGIGKIWGENTQWYQNQTKAVQEAQIAYDKQSAKVEDLTRKQARNNEAIVQNEIATNKLRGEEQFLGKAVDDANKSINKQSGLLDENGKKLDQTDKNVDKITESLNKLTAMKGFEIAKQVIQELIDKIEECIQSYANFEEAAVSVVRTVDGLSKGEAGDFLRELSSEIPVAMSDLAQIASQGGQYGISKEDIKEYTRVMAALAKSTNLGMENTNAVAQLQGILRTSVDDYDRFASTIVYLGNNSRTTEKDIVNMAQSLAASGKFMKMSEADILGFSAALASTGGQAQGVGTAMVRLMEKIDEATSNGGELLENLANIAGMSANEFKNAFETDAAGTIVNLIGSMNKLTESGEDVYDIYKQLGITNIREKANLRNLIMTYDDLAEYIRSANAAWKENTALAEESELAYSTAASQMTAYATTVDNLKASIGATIEGDGTYGISALRSWLNDRIRLLNEYIESLPHGMSSMVEYSQNWHGIFGGHNRSPINPGSASQGAISRTGGGEWGRGYSARLQADEERASLEHWRRMGKVYSDGAESLVSQYESAYRAIHEQTERIRELYESTFDPMKKFSEKGQLTAKEFTKNLQNNTKKMTEYTDNLVKVLNDPRISDAVKEYLKGLDPSEAYKLVQDFANDKDGKLINSANEAMDKFNTAISDNAVNAGTATGEVTDQVVQSLEDANLAKVARDTGIDAMDGLIKGMMSREKAVYAAAKSAASAVSMALNKTLQINSPSKVTEKSGESVGEGLILGMQNMEKDVSAEAARLAILSANVYDGAIVGLQNGFNASFNVKTKDYTGILKQMNSKLGRNNTVVIEKPGRSSQSAVNDLERALVRGMLY